MAKDKIVTTTWRIPADLHAELKKIADHDGTSIHSVGIERLRSASIVARLDKLDADMAALKQMMREMLDQIELLK